MISNDADRIIKSTFLSIIDNFPTSNIYKNECNKILNKKMMDCESNVNKYIEKLLSNVVYLYEMTKMFSAMLGGWIEERHFPRMEVYKLQIEVTERVTKNDLKRLVPKYAEVYSNKYKTVREQREALEFDYIFHFTMYNLMQIFVGSFIVNKVQNRAIIDIFLQENSIEVKEAVFRYCQAYTNIVIGNVKFR